MCLFLQDALQGVLKLQYMMMFVSKLNLYTMNILIAGIG